MKAAGLILPWAAALGFALQAGAQEPENTAKRLRQHEQDFEKKVKAERESVRGRKKAAAKEKAQHVEKNVRELGAEVKDVGAEVGGAISGALREAGAPGTGKAQPTEKAGKADKVEKKPEKKVEPKSGAKPPQTPAR